MRDFLRARALLFNASAQIHNQLISEARDASVQTARTLNNEEGERFTQGSGSALQDQNARVKALAAAQAHQPEEVPSPSIIPAKTPRPLASFLILRDQLMREEIVLHNKYCSGNWAEMEVRLDQWREQNITRFQQLHLLLQSLNTPTAAQR